MDCRFFIPGVFNLFKGEVEDTSTESQATVELQQEPPQQGKLTQAVVLGLLLESLELAGAIPYRGGPP